MSEKIKISKCIDTGRKTKDNHPVIEIELEDNRSGSGFDAELLKLPLGIEIELNVANAPDYQGSKRYYFTLPKAQAGKTQKDWAYDKRLKSLECSINSIKLTGKEVTTKNILALAEEYFEYFNKK